MENLENPNQDNQNNISAGQYPIAGDKNASSNHSKFRVKMISITILAVIITSGIVGYAGFYYQKLKTDQLEFDLQQQVAAMKVKEAQLQEANNNLIENVPVLEENKNLPVIGTIALDKIDVQWEKELKEVKEICDENSVCYLVGKITNENPAYKGKQLFLEEIQGMGNYYKHFIISEGVKIYVESDDLDAKKIIITGVNDLPEEIDLPGTGYKLKKYYDPGTLFSDVTKAKKVFTNDRLGDFYLSEDGCLVAELPDHTAIAYDFKIPFIDAEKNDISVIFNDGSKNNDEYDYTIHSCGSLCTRLQEADISKLKPEERLEIVGKTSNGENIYAIKNPADQYLKDLYNDKTTMAYLSDDGLAGKSKYTYEQFINAKPYLYWKDPMGRWIEFLNSKFEVAAEMCKPVVYLYPQEKMNLDIKVNPNGGFTKTEPLYNDGWQVEATPEGKIKNISDGKNYDYLLWEGLGLDYPQSEKGWIVEKNNLNTFFDEKLQLLGLNEKESSDFKEYWLGRLNEKAYYKIYFLPQEEFNKLAPMEFSPLNPSTFIRVMMTAEGRDNYENIPAQIFPQTPIRNGFTAVEWGGALLK